MRISADENETLRQKVLDKITKVCTCKGISRAAVKKAIADGAQTIDDVKKAVGAGSGSCHGRNCLPKIQTLLDEAKSKRT